jgi:hypothetical protein
MPRPRLTLPGAAICLVVIGAVLAPLAVHWAAGRTLVWFDTQMLYAPQRWLVDEALRDLRLPLWNPYMGAGMPFLADSIHGVLHPVSILTAWLASGRSADVLIAGHVACAGLGAALLARDLGASRAGGALAAVVYAGSGFVLSMAGNLVFLAGAGSLPFCLAGLRRFSAEPRAGSLALAALGAAVLALSGDAQALMIGGVLGLALALEAGGWRGAARAVAAGTLGLLVAAVQLLPTAVHLPRTVRGGEGWIRAPLVWALEPWRLAELALPGLSWGPDPFLDQVYAALAGPGRWPEGTLPSPFAPSVFIGVLPLALAALGARQGRRGRLLGVLALGLLWIALGPLLGADAVLGRLPIWRSFRYAEKLVGPATLALALLAGLGLDAVAEGRVRGRTLLALAAGLAAGAVGSGLLSASRLPPEVGALAEARVLRGGCHLAGALAALGGWLLARGRLGPASARVALVVVAWGGLAAASPAALRPGDPASRLRASGPALEGEAPGPRIVTAYTHPPLFAAPGQEWSDQAGREQAALGYAAYNVRARYDSLTVNAAMFPTRRALVEEAFSLRWPLAARRYAVTHVLVDQPADAWQGTLRALATRGAERLGATAGGAELWKVPHRAWADFPAEVRAVPDERAAIAGLARGDGAVQVETAGAVQGGSGRVLSVTRGLEALRVEAQAPADATLVVADAWWPGWEATLDGSPVAILPADVLVRAVRWPAGRHVLEMRYRPAEVRHGIWLSALGLAALAGGMVALRRGRAAGGIAAPPR